jgi:hypothetical protein
MISKFDFNNFCDKCNAHYLSCATAQRRGQFFVNQFLVNFPNAAIPEDVDCYYDDKKLAVFLQFVKKFFLDEFDKYCDM